MFRFRLQQLLRLRENVRDERRAELARVLEEERALQCQQQSIDGEMLVVERTIRNVSRPGTIELRDLLSAQQYRLLLQSERDALQSHHRRLADEVERRRERLAEADREVRVMEKLRERQQFGWQRKLANEQLRQIDEAMLWKLASTEDEQWDRR